MAYDIPRTYNVGVDVEPNHFPELKHRTVVICANAREVERVQTWWAASKPCPWVYVMAAHSEGLSLHGYRFPTIILRGVAMDELSTALKERLVTGALPDCTWIGLP